MASKFADAIAHAEGFGQPNAIPTRAHNPGDLALGNKGHGVLGSEDITVYADDAEGWAALEHQLTLIRSRLSHVYVPNMTIAEMSERYTATEAQAWAANVVDYLKKHGYPKVTTSTMLRDVL